MVKRPSGWKHVALFVVVFAAVAFVLYSILWYFDVNAAQGFSVVIGLATAFVVTISRWGNAQVGYRTALKRADRAAEKPAGAEAVTESDPAPSAAAVAGGDASVSEAELHRPAVSAPVAVCWAANSSAEAQVAAEPQVGRETKPEPLSEPVAEHVAEPPSEAVAETQPDIVEPEPEFAPEPERVLAPAPALEIAPEPALVAAPVATATRAETHSSVASNTATDGWLADPTGRHEMRYRGAKGWTDWVKDSGFAHRDHYDPSEGV